MIELNDKIAEELFNEWRTRLGLEDWIITLRYNCKFSDMELENVDGETEWSTSTKDAVIRILDPKEYGKRIEDFDFEKVLVHELLHLKFAILDCEKGSYESKVMEVVRHQLIDDLARALVMAKRGEIKRKLAKGCKLVKDINEPKKEIEITPLGSTTKLVVEK